MLSAFILAVALQAAIGGTTLQGVVVDPSGTPVEGARVVAIDGGHTLSQTQTDAEGRFTLAVPASPQFVRVSAPGFGDHWTRLVTCPLDQTGPTNAEGVTTSTRRTREV